MTETEKLPLLPNSDGAVSHPTLQLAPLCAPEGDTWITIGDGLDVENGTEERTVSVVFKRTLDEEHATDDLLRPFHPVFPAGR